MHTKVLENRHFGEDGWRRCANASSVQRGNGGIVDTFFPGIDGPTITIRRSTTNVTHLVTKEVVDSTLLGVALRNGAALRIRHRVFRESTTG